MQPYGEGRAVVTVRQGRLGLRRQVIGWIAAYGLVLHTVLAGAVAAQFAVAAVAPGFELCVTHPDGGPAPAQGQHQHDQCVLHCAAFAGFATLVLALIAFVFPLRPIGYAPIRRAYRAPSSYCRAGLSRAPPLPA